MAKMKSYLGGAWVTLDAKNLRTVNGIFFRVLSNKLQYSTNNIDWFYAG